jgi:hypothetical protein
MLWVNGHHDHDFAHLWCAAAPGAQRDLIDQSPDRTFRPPYVGTRGWIGVRLDGPVVFDEIEMLLEDAYRCVATKRQIALLDDHPSESSAAEVHVRRRSDLSRIAGGVVK